jgi:hypothetical protein
MKQGNRVVFCTISIVLGMSMITGCTEEAEERMTEALAAIDEEDTGAPRDLRSMPTVEVLDGVLVATPPPGMRVLVEVIYEDGHMELVDVTTSEDGEVETRNHGAEWGLAAPMPATDACPTKCADDRSSLTGHHWQGTLAWSYRDANRPAALDKQATIAALAHGASGPPSARDACGLDDSVGAAHAYLGETNTAPNIVVQGDEVLCGSTDGHNVVGWADLPGGTLGVTCTWSYASGRAAESDMLYDTGVSWYTGNTAPAGCAAQFSLRGVATHEFGHAFGLGHAPGNSCNLTMYPSTWPCNDGARRFGLGDVQGLESIY